MQYMKRSAYCTRSVECGLPACPVVGCLLVLLLLRLLWLLGGRRKDRGFSVIEDRQRSFQAETS